MARRISTGSGLGCSSGIMGKACAAQACLSACWWGASICAGHGRSLEDKRLRPCPGGTIENSPTFQRWEPNDRRAPVPEGRLSSLPQVTLVVGNPVFLEQRQELLLKGHLPVVLRLTLDVMNASESAVPSGLMQRRSCIPNVETLGYSRRVPPRLIHPGPACPRFCNPAERIGRLQRPATAR